MKYTATTLMCLLLLGVCSAEILRTGEPMKMDDMKRMADDYWKLKSGKNIADDQSSQQTVQLKDTVYQKFKDENQQLTGNPYSHHLHLFEEFPDLADPLTVGSTDDQHVKLRIHYNEVQFRGLNSSTSAVLHIDTSSQMATLTLSMGKAEIRGQYNASDNNSGNFIIKMSEHLTYVSKFPYIKINDTYVKLVNTSGQLFYNSYTSDYSVGTYSPAIQKDLQHNLMQLVNERIYQELYAKYSDSIRHLILELFSGDQSHDESVEKAMRETVNEVVDGFQMAVSGHVVDSIDLTSNDKEMVYNKLKAKIASVKLNGIRRFYHIPSHDVDKIHAKVALAIDRPTATALVTINEAHDEDSPFQKISVNFNMEQLMADLSLGKFSQSGLILRSIQTKINRIWPVGTEKFESRIGNLIKEKLTGHMKRYIEEGLKTFIRNELRHTCFASKSKKVVCIQSDEVKTETWEMNKNLTQWIQKEELE